MTILRRTALKLLGATPFALGRVGQELGNNNLNINKAPLPSGNVGYEAATTQAGLANNPIYDKAMRDINRWMKASAGYRADIRDVINSETQVSYIDPDLLAMRSLSQAARIYYMRQRLVDRHLNAHFGEDDRNSVWKATERWRAAAVKALGLGDLL